MGKRKSQKKQPTGGETKSKPLSTYKVGDINKKGFRIERIIASSKQYIIYATENNRISFETDNLDARLQPAVNEYKRLAADVSVYFKGMYTQEISTLLVSALTNALNSKKSENCLSYFKAAHDFIKEKGKIKTVYGFSDDFIVWLDLKNNLSWSYNNITDDFQKIIAEFEELKGIVQTTLPQSHHSQINSMMGFSLVAAFRAPIKKSAVEYVDSIREFITKRSEAYARAQLLIFSLASSTALAILLLLIHYTLGVTAAAAKNIVLGSIGGVIGASVSMVYRNRLVVVDPFVPSASLMFLGFVRVFLGMIFGGLIVVMSKANLVLGILQNNMHSLFIVAVLSGFAERFFPDILERLTIEKAGIMKMK